MTKTRVNEIDLLRFAAALMVVVYHFAFRGRAADNLTALDYPPLIPIAKYGYLGVELFFMISGFVILMTAANGSLRAFLVSRVVRLYPAFWVCCALTFVFSLALGGDRFQVSVTQWLVNMSMLAEFFGVTSIDDVYWSLYIEIQFYALVAIVLMLGAIARTQALLVIWMLGAAILEVLPVSTLRELFITRHAPFFAAGAACFLIWRDGPTRGRAFIVAGAWVMALYQCLSGINKIQTHYATPMSPLVVACIVSAFFVVMLLVALRRTGSLGRIEWPMLGALTYPLYLLHQNIGYMVFNHLAPLLNLHLLFWSVVAASLLAARAVHVHVERPLGRALRNALSRP